MKNNTKLLQVQYQKINVFSLQLVLVKQLQLQPRIAYLVEYYDIDPSKILLVTFSRAAAQEMIHRVHKLIGPVQMYAGTFHALSAQILRDMAPKMLFDQPFIDELPYRLVKWLETDRAQKWVQRFRTIIVDEFQDINEIQWQLLKGFLSSVGHNVYCRG